MRRWVIYAWLGVCLGCTLPVPQADAAERLRVSPNHRFLVRADGSPFFYLGDTAWALFYRLTLDEAEIYLKDRQQKGFTVIQAVAISGAAGEQNAHGQTALLPRDPEKPYDAKTNPFDPARPNEAYFAHVDAIVARAAGHGLFVAMLPTWGSNVTSRQPLFNADNARAFGEFLGKRYCESPIIWVLGGDENPAGYEAVWRAMAEGLKAGDGGTHLVSYHPRGGGTSSRNLHKEPWLDFNMLQSGHSRFRPAGQEVYNLIGRDWQMAPPKPCMNAEPAYETNPEGLTRGNKRSPFDPVDPKDRITDYDVRRIAYWSLFAGAHGHAYGANGVMQFTKKEIKSSWRWDPRMTWDKAIVLPGSAQMRFARRLLESRPFLVRVPDQSVLASPEGHREDHEQATRASDGSYAMVYLTSGKTVLVNLAKISGGSVTAWWYDPRRGRARSIGPFPTSGTKAFVPPTSGPDNDWVLVLDDASRKFPPPGTPK